MATHQEAYNSEVIKIATIDGNLGAHIRTLQDAAYVEVIKETIGRRTRTWAALTDAGRHAFREHVSYLEEILAPPRNLGITTRSNPK